MTIVLAENDERKQVCVIGLGNVFLGDDGFGPLFVEVFRCEYEYSSNVEVLDLGTPGLDLGPYLYNRELVVRGPMPFVRTDRWASFQS